MGTSPSQAVSGSEKEAETDTSIVMVTVISFIAGCFLCCCCCIGIALRCCPRKSPVDLAGDAKSEKETDSNDGNNEEKEAYSNNVIEGVECPSNWANQDLSNV